MRSSRNLVAPKAALLAALLCAGGGCADFHRGPSPLDAAGVGGNADVVPAVKEDATFENVVHPILVTRCSLCHAAGKEAGTSRLVLTADARSDRAMVLALLTGGSPSESRLLICATGGNMHSGGERLSPDSEDYQAIVAWATNLKSAP